MKMAAFLAAAVLACGSAVAADSGAEHGQRANSEHAAKQPSGDGILDRTKRAFSRMGDRIRSTGERLGQKLGTDKDSRHDTRAMGAGGSEQAHDQGRRQRMDEAYANWREQQEKR